MGTDLSRFFKPTDRGIEGLGDRSPYVTSTFVEKEPIDRLARNVQRIQAAGCGYELEMRKLCEAVQARVENLISLGSSVTSKEIDRWMVMDLPSEISPELRDEVVARLREVIC